MIKALILIHLWSLVVATCAWGLQRDGDGRVGARFPDSNIWLILITLSFLPGVLSIIPFGAAITLPQIEAFEMLPIQVSESAAKTSETLNLLAVYIGLSLLLMSRTLWRWGRLQILPLMPTTEPGIYTTTSEMPPLTLSWPRRAVVIPVGYKIQGALILHERAHLSHNDAELTLFLLLLQDIMLRSPGVSYLVRQWRLAIELRADHAATKRLTPSERKEYAALLLNTVRPTGGRGEPLPCPTAQLSSTRHRNVKMRLREIMEIKAAPRKRCWVAAVLISAIGASLLGVTTSAAVIITNKVLYLDLDPIEYSKHVLPQIPESCPGLKRDDVKFGKKEVIVNGNPVMQHVMDIGLVALNHDVRRDGSIYNPHVLYSTHACFEAEAKAAIIQWKTEPQNFEIREAGIKLHFIVLAESLEDLETQLSDYLK